MRRVEISRQRGEKMGEEKSALTAWLHTFFFLFFLLTRQIRVCHIGQKPLWIDVGDNLSGLIVEGLIYMFFQFRG